MNGGVTLCESHGDGSGGLTPATIGYVDQEDVLPTNSSETEYLRVTLTFRSSLIQLFGKRCFSLHN